MSNVQKIGLFGGSFDPIHLGHVEIAQMAIKEIPLDILVVMPAGKAPHKNGAFFSDELRLKMTQAAMADLNDDRINVSDWEMKQAQVNGKTSFTVDTMRYLKKKYPGAELYLILGTDMFNTLSTWKDPEIIAANMKLVLVNRRGEKLYKPTRKKDSVYTNIYSPDVVISAEPLEVSSTEIRRRLASGESVVGLVPDSALQVLKNASFDADLTK
ncbi:MAG: nicotinate (nicotinamide) nucleotide adenylyltransferase [Thermoguttaceae bacterium]|nr:nicotinate (nicotinamide) nucleotide adenylyltransferase [Thermoguttaceae bacterium]